MNYNLKRSERKSRAAFVKYANRLLREERTNVQLVDASKRSLKQNSYIHVLCRILASETGESTSYAKQMYFKELANRDLFLRTTKDPITKKMTVFYRSTSDLSVPEMNKAIDNFIQWAAHNGYDLPKATVNVDGSIHFDSDEQKNIYNDALVKTSYLD